MLAWINQREMIAVNYGVATIQAVGNRLQPGMTVNTRTTATRQILGRTAITVGANQMILNMILMDTVLAVNSEKIGILQLLNMFVINIHTLVDTGKIVVINKTSWLLLRLVNRHS